MYKGYAIQLVLPAFDEVGKIGQAVRRIPRPLIDHVVVVDDGSKDETAAEAGAAGATVLRHDHNLGVGAAIRTGIEHAVASGVPLVGILAGDDQDDPLEILRLADAIIDDGHDLVQGSRYLPGGRFINQPASRTIMTKAYSALFSLCVGRRITDATNGFKLFRASLCTSLALDQEWLDGYELEPYLLFQAIRRNHRVTEVPVTKFYPPDQATGYTKMRAWRDWWRISRPMLLLTLHLRA
jgi:dolichol-phosphate mannosyltransferase